MENFSLIFIDLLIQCRMFIVRFEQYVYKFFCEFSNYLVGYMHSYRYHTYKAFRQYEQECVV